MNSITNTIKNNPVRVYTVVIALVAFGSRYIVDFPTDLVLALVAAVLGIGGEVTNRKVTANRLLDVE